MILSTHYLTIQQCIWIVSVMWIYNLNRKLMCDELKDRHVVGTSDPRTWELAASAIDPTSSWLLPRSTAIGWLNEEDTMSSWHLWWGPPAPTFWDHCWRPLWLRSVVMDPGFVHCHIPTQKIRFISSRQLQTALVINDRLSFLIHREKTRHPLWQQLSHRQMFMQNSVHSAVWYL